MKLATLLFLALAGSATSFIIGTTTGTQNQDGDQHELHQLKQNNTNQDSQLYYFHNKHQNTKQEDDETNRRVAREATLPDDECGEFSFPCPQCGGKFNSASGIIRHPLSGGHYHNNEHCTWIIRSNERINITFTQFGTENGFDFLHIRDSSDSTALGELSGRFLPHSIQTMTTSAYIVFTSDGWNTSTGFELKWEPAVETFYQVPIGSDFELDLNFNVTLGPVDLKWEYGNISPGKFSSNLNCKQFNNQYNSCQERLMITGVTEDDLDTQLKLRVTDEIGEKYYRAMLSALPGPPSSVNISSILGSSLRISWDNSLSLEDSFSYVVQYKLWNTTHDYTEITEIGTNHYTIRDLTPSTSYEFRVIAVDKLRRGLPTEPLYITTHSCGGEYNSKRGMIRHPFNGGNYQNNEQCTWIIRTTEKMLIRIPKFDTERRNDYLYIGDGVSESKLVNLLEKISGKNSFWYQLPNKVNTFRTSVNITFTSDGRSTKSGFELHWEPQVETFYNVPIGSDYEVHINFTVTPGPSALEWYFGPNFHDMPNIIEIPRDKGKFATSLIEIPSAISSNYTAVLKIRGVSQDDLQTKYKLSVTNEFGETNYRVMLYAFPRPLVRILFSDVMSEAVRLSWDYTEDHGNISSYVIQYKPTNTNQDYVEIAGLISNVYTLRGLTPSTGYWVRVLAVHTNGRGPPSNPIFISTKELGCGGEVNFSTGILRHPLSGNQYQNNENCIWIIRSTETIKIKFTRFETERRSDYLRIYDGGHSDSNRLGSFSGNLISEESLQRSVSTTSTIVRLLFKSNSREKRNGFELHWEPVVQMFYQIPVGNDYEVSFKFPVNLQPIASKWLYGPSFQEMSSSLQIPSDNGKFSTSLINFENNMYQANLKIAKVKEEDTETMFKLHVTDAVGEVNYRVMLSAFCGPPSSIDVSDVMPEALRISWSYNSDPGSISSYVIQYRPWNTNQDYVEIDNIQTMFYIIRGLKPSTVYGFRVLAVNNFGRGPPSEITYNTTKVIGCGGEHNSTRGTIIHYLDDPTKEDIFAPSSGFQYKNNVHCIWVIRSTERMNITFAEFHIHIGADFLYIRDGDNINSKELAKLTGYDLPNCVRTTTGTAYLLFTSNTWMVNSGFRLNWEPKVETFYQIPVGSDYELQLKFSPSLQPTDPRWFYGPSFQEVQQSLQIPSEDEKFSTSLIDLENNTYQAVLKIARIEKKDLDTKFILGIRHGADEFKYRLMLSGSSSPTPSLPIFSDILANSVQITIKFDYGIPGDISSYVIQYKPKNTDEEYTEVAGLSKNSNIVRGLSSSTEYEFRVLAEHKFGRGLFSETAYVNTSCGAELTLTSGMLRHPLSDGKYQNWESCMWSISATERMTIKITQFDTESKKDYLTVRDGETTDSNLLEKFSGNLNDYTFPSSSLTTTSTSVNMLFTSDRSRTFKGFELYWEPAVETFYNIPIGNEFEVQLNFSVHPEPTALKWSYGPSFQEMTNIIQIPSDDGKFSASFIGLRDNNYTAFLKINEISKDDFETKFKLHVTNELGVTYYRVILSAFAHPPSVQIINITDTTVHVSWDYGVNSEDISSYVIQYKPWNTDEAYTEISELVTNSYTITGLWRSTTYEIQLLAVNKIGRGLPSRPSFFTTRCPEEFFRIKGTNQCFRLFKEQYNWKEASLKCTDEGLHLAHPSDETAPALWNYIYVNYDGSPHVWLGAQRVAPESEVLWQYPGEVGSSDLTSIPQNSRLWYPRFGPDGYYSDAHDTCVRLMVSDSEPEQPYVLIPCQDSNCYTLCEDFDPRLE